MKKITICIVLALLCLNFKAKAQGNKAVDVSLKGIQIGQKVPDVNITGLYNYKDADGKPSTTAKLSDFKGKLLILDFWATWCGPCVGMIPKMDSLQKALGNKIQFISVTYQTEKEVLPFLEKFEKQHAKQYGLPNVFGDKALHDLFPHRELPHYVWIDKEGKLLSVTGLYEVTVGNIQKILNMDVPNMEQKTDVIVKYDRESPLFFNEAFRKNILMQSNISGYIDGIAGGMWQNIRKKNIDQVRRITIMNGTVPFLYAVAFGKGKELIGENRMVLNVADTGLLKTKEKGAKFKEWMKKNSFCYEVTVPENLKDNAWGYMKADLDRFFYQYSVSFEKRKIKCYVLQKTSGEDKTKSKSETSFVKMGRDEAVLGNAYLSRFISQLNLLAQQYSPYPLVDGSGINSTVDINIQANLSSIPEINKALKAYDLEFALMDWDIDLLVIKDKS